MDIIDNEEDENRKENNVEVLNINDNFGSKNKENYKKKLTQGN